MIGQKNLRFPTNHSYAISGHMEKYKIIVKKSVAKDLRPLPKKDIAAILKCIESLKEEPRPFGCEKLSGQERYRIRKGSLPDYL